MVVVVVVIAVMAVEYLAINNPLPPPPGLPSHGSRPFLSRMIAAFRWRKQREAIVSASARSRQSLVLRPHRELHRNPERVEQRVHRDLPDFSLECSRSLHPATGVPIAPSPWNLNVPSVSFWTAKRGGTFSGKFEELPA